MKKSLWLAYFASNIGWSGNGVITFHNNQATGGDNQFYYIGDYKIDAESNTVKARVLVKSYKEPSLATTGPTEFHAEFSGPYHKSEMTLKAVVKEDPTHRVSVSLRKIADL
jgi:hypothetical protein